ncbi:MAG: sulfatase-like hydrolase/transferase, partial [Ferruginibacter sp.]
ITVPDGSTLDYMFLFKKKSGPFNISFFYADMNENPGKKFYHSLPNANEVIRINANLDRVMPTKSIPLLIYSALFVFGFGIMAIILFIVKKPKIKSSFKPVNKASLFFAISAALLIILVIVRAVITGETVRFLIAPFHHLPVIFRTSLQDLLYTCLLTIVAGLLFLLLPKRRRLILYVFGGVCALSIVAAMINIKIIEMLGRPFTYQWLYYSDFLSSTDASRAIRANVEKQSLAAYFLMITATLPLIFIIYYLLRNKPAVVPVLLFVCLGIGFFAKDDRSIKYERKQNPVIYFLSSLLREDGVARFGKKDKILQQQFLLKNKNVVQPVYGSKFSREKIKNVILFVLESTPAEYITPYNRSFEATPFLDSIKASSVLFDAIYAHAPATNKSMVSLLCSVYPYLSYKSITAQRPAIGWASLSSELSKDGYRTSFFNSGDNRFQGAENFLQHRGMDEIQDFRQNTCQAKIFSDSRYPNENLEGINDACLPVKFFDWMKNDFTTPFFSMMWTYQTHYPYYLAERRINFHSNNESQEKYLNALHDADNTLRLLVEGLEKRNLLKSTLVVVVGDHGEAFGRHGQTSHAGGIYEENLHIPLILINPELFQGEHMPQVGGISDVAPTILSILNKRIPDEWQGENLFSLNRRNKVYFFSPYSDYLFGCREGNYKLLYNATTNVYSLYDLKTDPFESTDIASKHPQYVKELSAGLNAWIQYQTEYVNSFLK